MEQKNLRDEIVKAIDGRLSVFEDKINGKFAVFEEKIGGRFTAFEDKFNRRIGGVETKMDEGFRKQGVLMEKMQSDVDTLVEGQAGLHHRINQLDNRMEHLEAVDIEA